MEIDPLAVSPDNIWCYPQNRMRLVLRDMERFGVPQEITRRVLLARGVYKWMSCRRDIIKLKDNLKVEIRGLHELSRVIPRGRERDMLMARLHALEEVRAELRGICHSERWRMEAE